MKGRSQRLPAPPTVPMDDWLDGSWTVDCPCGVTFDDGEEMVKCDECGVWVHTRCTRFVKEEASFTCDKCKTAKPRALTSTAPAPAPIPDNIEETEVAQLLAELPNKADPCPPPPAYQRPPFRRWAELPMEEKVHVQGVPGGESSLFTGISTVFSRELWKCTGYVPKKFNIKYKEFPCWDEEESENPASTGANVLFSLSKEGVVERPPSPQGGGSRDGKSLFSRGGHNFKKKERSKFRVPVSHAGKGREEEQTRCKDGTAKKIRVSGSGDKSRGLTTRISRSDSRSIGKETDQGQNSEFEKLRSEDKKVEKPSGSTGDFHTKQKHRMGDSTNASSTKSSYEPLIPGQPICKLLSESHVKTEKVRIEVHPCHRNSSRLDDSRKPSGDVAAEASTKEDARADNFLQSGDISCDHMNLKNGSSNTEVQLRQLENSVGDFGVTSVLLDSTNLSMKEVRETNIKEEVISNSRQVNGNPPMQTPLVIGESQANTSMMEYRLISGSFSYTDFQFDGTPKSFTNDACQLQANESEHVRLLVHENIPEVNSGSSDLMKLGPHQQNEEHKQSLEWHHELSTREPATSSSPSNIATSVNRLATAITKHALTSNAEPSSTSDCYKPPGTMSSSTAARTVPFTKRIKVTSSSNTNSNKERSSIGLSFEGHTHEHKLKVSENFGNQSSEADKAILALPPKQKVLDLRETINAPLSKQKSIDVKESMPFPSKASSTENPTSSFVSGTSSTTVQVKLDPNTKNLRISSPNPQPSNKTANHPITVHPPVLPNVITNAATLSDEELAKRLHHELNSSPRVSRVPRGLHASGVQVASSTSTSMLSKRSSTANSGVKLQVLVSRRKNKEDATKDVPDKAEKLEDMSSHKKESESFHTNYLIKKDVNKSSHGNLSSTKESGQLAPLAVGDSGPPFRTLQGLIDDIMNAGKHMTYEELCDAVLPHWPNLRKSDGEKYANSSHSLAVLDCLRNRNEWAYLIDYEPKTYSSKKRNKSSIPPSVGASENGNADGRVSAEQGEKTGDLCTENLPTKGKRLARKRRKLMLRGRAVHVTRKREITDAVSENDVESFSGEEGSQSFSSREEVQGSRRSKNTNGLMVSSEYASD